MRRRLQSICGLLFLALLFPVAGRAGEDSLPAPLVSFSAEYSLSHGYLELGRVKVTLDIDGEGGYRYSALTSPVGLTAMIRNDVISEISSGRLGNNAVTPNNYVYRHQNSGKPRLVELEFDWERGRVTNNSGGSRWSMQILPGTQDKFSQRLALMMAVASGQRSVELPVADGGRAKTYRFRFLGEEVVEVDAGRFQALKFERTKNQRPSRVSLWLAPELGYLPVMVKREEKDGLYWMQLRSVKWR